MGSVWVHRLEGEHAEEDDSHEAADAVDRPGVEGIVPLHARLEDHRAIAERAGQEAEDKGGPRGNVPSGRGDAGEAGHRTGESTDKAGLARARHQVIASQVKRLWDVRSYPSSRWEWFRRDRMEEWLPEAEVEYRWVPALGGRREPRRGNARETARPAAQEPLPPAWHEKGFSSYQWHMTTEEFLAAADELAELGGRLDVAIMCAEGVWWRCHRSMIADRLRRYDPEVLAAWRRHLGPTARRLDDDLVHP
jgi:hypothetical protein